MRKDAPTLPSPASGGGGDRTVCPGCGAELPASGLPLDLKRNASAECLQVASEVTGFEFEHTAQLGRFHQLMVDAYGAQHADASGRGIRVAYSLVGLYLFFDRGMNGLQIRQTHQRMGKPQADWPAFPRPATTGELTIVDVAEAGARKSSVEGHAEAIERWAKSVWKAWTQRQSEVERLANRFVARAR